MFVEMKIGENSLGDTGLVSWVRVGVVGEGGEVSSEQIDHVLVKLGQANPRLSQMVIQELHRVHPSPDPSNRLS